MKFRLPLSFILLSTLAMIGWVSRFHLPWVLLPVHVVAICLVHLIGLGVIASLYYHSRYRMVALGLVSVWLCVWLLFYLLIYSSMQLWGDIITLKILGTYLLDINAFLDSLPYQRWQLVGCVMLFFAFPVVIIYLFRGVVMSSLSDYSDYLYVHRKWLLAVLLVGILASPLLLRAKRVAHKAGEPLLVMLYDHMWGVTDNPLFNQERIKVGFQDQAIRAAYKATPHPIAKRNVILIIVDALRADHLGCYGYRRPTSPFIDELVISHSAARVAHCYATCACTLCGVTSTLLSRIWEQCAMNGFNLIGLLHDQGYPAYALISGAHREWYNMAKLYSDDCTLYWDGKDSRRFYFKDDRVLLEGLERVPPYHDSASFFYFHLQSTHETGLLLDRYTPYRPFKRSITTAGLSSQEAINEYDNKVVQADATIRQLFGALAAKGYLKNSTIIITADHGQGLGEHRVTGHVDWLYEPQIAVPLIIYDDSIARYQNLSIARQIDIAPTIIERLELPIPSCWRGTSLLSPNIAAISHHETGKNGLETGLQKYATIYHTDSATYKYIYTSSHLHDELYDLTNDSLELKNIIHTEIGKEVIKKLK